MPRYWLLKTEPSAFSFEQLRTRRHDAVDGRAQLSSAQQHDGDEARRPRALLSFEHRPARGGRHLQGRPRGLSRFHAVRARRRLLRRTREAGEADLVHGRRRLRRSVRNSRSRWRRCARTRVSSAWRCCAADSASRCSRSCRTNGRSSWSSLADRLRLREKDALRVDRHLARPRARSALVAAVALAARGS